MKVIVLGAGQVGSHIAKQLAQSNHDVTIVDLSDKLLTKISESLDIQPICGFASHPDILAKAGAENADLLIAVTSSDEVNILACQIARSVFNIPKRIARVRTQRYLMTDWGRIFSPEHLAIDVVISPEKEVALSIARSVEVFGAFDVVPFMDDDMKAIGLACQAGAEIINTPIRLVETLFPRIPFSIVCIRREDEVFIPSPDDVIELDDEVYFLCPTQHIHNLIKAFGFKENFQRQLLIFGGGAVAYSLAETILSKDSNIRIKIIEKNPQRAEYIARTLNDVEVMCGDVLDYELLLEANIEDASTVIAVTDDDKVNMLSSLLAKRYGAERILTLLNNIHYSSLMISLGIHAVINPRSITSSTVLQSIKEEKSSKIYSLFEGEVDLIEAEAKESSHAVGLSVEEINEEGEVHIACIIRNGEYIMNPQEEIIELQDDLIIACEKQSIVKIERLFASKLKYFPTKS